MHKALIVPPTRWRLFETRRRRKQISAIDLSADGTVQVLVALVSDPDPVTARLAEAKPKDGAHPESKAMLQLLDVSGTHEESVRTIVREFLREFLRSYVSNHAADSVDAAYVLQHEDELVKTALGPLQEFGCLSLEYSPPNGERALSDDFADIGGCPWAVELGVPIYSGTPPKIEVK